MSRVYAGAMITLMALCVLGAVLPLGAVNAEVALLAYAAIRYFSSPVEYDARGELFQVGVCGLVYFVCATQFERPSDRSFFLVAFMILAVFESVYVICQA